MSDGLTPSQVQAAEEFAELAPKRLQATNVATVIAGTARMAGTFLFRSFNFHFEGAKPGDAALSVEANEKGPRLMNILGGVLSYLGIDVGDGFVESTDKNNEPTLEFLDTQKLLEPQFDKIRRKYELSFEDAADATAAAVAFLIKENSEGIDKDVAFGIGVYGFIEGTKTIPFPLPEDS